MIKKLNNSKNRILGSSLPESNLILTLLIVSILVVSGCTQPTPSIKPVILGGGEATGDLKEFSSAEEIKEFLTLSQLNQISAYSSFSGEMSRSSGMMDVAMAENSMANAQVKTATSNGADDYSTTNIQVQGVDEPDFVKNDDKYIYLVKDNLLYVVDAYPAEDAEIVSETEISGNVQNILINEDRLIVFARDNTQVSYISKYDYLPRQRYVSQTHAFVYDINDKTDLELINDFNINGNYKEARMIGDYVYFITQESLYDPVFIDFPVIRNAEKEIATSKVYYFDNPETNYNFNTVTSFNIFEEEEVESKTFMIGYSNTIYVSENNIYITHRKNVPWRYYQEDAEYRFYEIIVPLLPNNVQDEIDNIKSSLSSEEKWNKISSILEDMYNEMGESTKNNLVEEIAEALEEHQVKQEIERRKTIIHKINIDDGKIDYDEKGEVNGYLLNQFSLDEHEDNLRVATTTNVWAGRDSQVYNNVYVLNKNMNVVGDIEDIAPGERIYSTRFIGDRLYMVTFKNIDPFFVIDLSEATNPEILGELKIPGYSSYLHPYDENHIIGIGKETEANQWGGVSTAGVKIALFDVSDVENPLEVDTYEIGEAGTDSEALRDHKAFLFSKEKNLLVLPIREVKDRYYDDSRGYYRNRIWHGAYVLNIDETGISLNGKVTHQDDADDEWYYSYQNAVRRSIYMDDTLYTISNNFIKANNLANDLNKISELEFSDTVVLGSGNDVMRDW